MCLLRANCLNDAGLLLPGLDYDLTRRNAVSLDSTFLFPVALYVSQ
jgi:hypothetical protein